MINAIPVIGWIISFVCSVSLAIPFWICWTACGLGETYFYFLPERYHAIPFWHCVGLFIMVPIAKRLITPTFVSTSQSVETNKEKK